MINLKTLGIALAALMVSAMGASSASAQIVGGEFTASSYPAHVTGADNPATTHALTGAAGIDCTSTTYTGTLSAGGSLDLTPDFTGCAASSGAPMTVTHNGCNYRITVGTGTGGTPEDWHASADLVCPENQQIELHLYNSAAHTTSICTLEIPAQNNLTGLTLTDSNNNSIIVEGTIPGIVNRASGGCTGGPTVALPNAELHVNLTISATSPNSIDIGVTE